MSTFTYRYKEIKTKRVKKYICDDGKKRQVTRVFSQTINPFNKNKDGTQKTSHQIMDEIEKEADLWMKSDNLEKCGKF